MPSARDKNITLIDQVQPGFLPSGSRSRHDLPVGRSISSATPLSTRPPGGTVRVATELNESDRVVKILVSDTGVGIPPDAMRHLFEKFYRVEQSKGMAKGTGLGLNLTRHMIETVHKGKMIVGKRTGQVEATFGFYLAHSRSSFRSCRLKQQGVPYEQQNNPSSSSMMKPTFCRWFRSSSRTRASSVLHRWQPTAMKPSSLAVSCKTSTLVITDYQMPGPTGLEFARKLHKEPGKRDLPVILLTAHGLASGSGGTSSPPASPVASVNPSARREVLGKVNSDDRKR